MFHTLAFAQATAAGPNTDVILPAVSDDFFTRQNNAFQIPTDLNLLAAAALGTTVTHMRVNTPTTRLRGFPQIQPTISAVTPPTNPNMMDFRDFPLHLFPFENLEIDFSNTAAGAENDSAVVWLATQDHNFNINTAELRWARFTASPTLVLNSWSIAVPVNFQDTLEGGNYGVYGLICYEANGVAARCVFVNQVWRPGALMTSPTGTRSHEMFRGGLGYWGTFNTYQGLQIQEFATGAGAATIEGHLLIGKLAA